VAKEGEMLYRRCLALILVGLLFVVLVGPAAHALPSTRAPLTTSPSVPSTVPAPAPDSVPQVSVPAWDWFEPTIAAYNLLELWPLGMSLLLVLGLSLVNRRHARR
jgi:hypothetical protein